MTSEVAAILDRVRALGRDERAQLALELVALLEGAAEDAVEAERDWTVELARRAERVASGTSAGRPWGEVRERLLARRR